MKKKQARVQPHFQVSLDQAQTRHSIKKEAKNIITTKKKKKFDAEEIRNGLQVL